MENLITGLSSAEAQCIRARVGPNATPDVAIHPVRLVLSKFLAPVSVLLEIAIVLQLALGEYVEGSIIAALLVFNTALGFFHESRAQATIAALKSQLPLNASVLRDGVWITVPAAKLVPEDIVKLSLSTVVAADVQISEGSILLDQSMLTGESLPVEAGPGTETYAGALVRLGEAVADVRATGTRTKFGRAADLVRTAYVVSTEQKAVFRAVRNLAGFNGAVTLADDLLIRNRHAVIRSHSSGTHIGSRLGSSRVTRDIYACNSDRSAGPRACGCASDPTLCGR